MPDATTAVFGPLYQLWEVWASRASLRAAALSGREVEVVHLVGGGACNTLLCQLTADACGLPVLAGPVEAAALGNVLVQACGIGVLSGGLPELRALLRNTQDAQLYLPTPGAGNAWDAAEARISPRADRTEGRRSAPRPSGHSSPRRIPNGVVRRPRGRPHTWGGVS